MAACLKPYMQLPFFVCGQTNEKKKLFRHVIVKIIKWKVLETWMAGTNGQKKIVFGCRLISSRLHKLLFRDEIYEIQIGHKLMKLKKVKTFL